MAPSDPGTEGLKSCRMALLKFRNAYRRSRSSSSVEPLVGTVMTFLPLCPGGHLKNLITAHGSEIMSARSDPLAWDCVCAAQRTFELPCASRRRRGENPNTLLNHRSARMSRRSNPPHCEHREGQIQGKVVRTLTAGAVEFATLPGGDLQRTTG